MRSPAGRLAVLLAVLGALVAACVVEDAEQGPHVVAEGTASEAPTSSAEPSSGFWPLLAGWGRPVSRSWTSRRSDLTMTLETR